MKKGVLLLFFIVLVLVIFLENKRSFTVVRVQDGDGFILNNGKRIRLYGIDAPELLQTCKNKEEEVECGKFSQAFLEEKVLGKKVKCKFLRIDKYKRNVSVCFSDGENINEYMVRNGWAVAYKKYTSDYRHAESLAKKEKLGIWQWKFLMPETYRKHERKEKYKNKNGKYYENSR